MECVGRFSFILNSLIEIIHSYFLRLLGKLKWRKCISSLGTIGETARFFSLFFFSDDMEAEREKEREKFKFAAHKMCGKFLEHLNCTCVFVSWRLLWECVLAVRWKNSVTDREGTNETVRIIKKDNERKVKK